MNDRTLDRPWMLIAQREVSTKLRDKTFIGSTAVMLLIVLAAVIIPAMIAGRGSADKIAVIDDAGAKVVQQASTTKGGDGFEVTRAADRPAAEQLVTSGDARPRWCRRRTGTSSLGKDRVDSGLRERAARGGGQRRNGAERGAGRADPGRAAGRDQGRAAAAEARVRCPTSCPTSSTSGWRWCST